MECEICGLGDREIIYILSIKGDNEYFNMMACANCARRSSAFCLVHDQIYIGFIDGVSVCNICVEKEVRRNACLSHAVLCRLLNSLPKDEIEVLMEMATISFLSTGGCIPISIPRIVITKAMRICKKIDEILDLVINEGSDRTLLS